jgi:hypothetical protein
LIRIPESTLARLADLAESTGTDLGTVIDRLLDRDPHDHEHRCPTCVRQTAAAERQQDPLTASIFELIEEGLVEVVEA